MTNRNTKRALLSSVMALFLCFAMLLGTTFAWFTDSVESGMNSIVAGNLDVELEYATEIKDGVVTKWESVAGKTLFDPRALWEPGRVEVVYLKVSNLGNLALKYQLGVNIDPTKTVIGTNVDGDSIDLADHLVFTVVEMPDTLTTYTDREAAVLATSETTKGFKDYNGVTTALEVGGTDYVALIVSMPTTVGNEANYKTGTTPPSIGFGVKLYATQQGAEEDSFGPDYDDGANHENFKVTTGLDLQNAVNEANPGDTIEIENDIVLTEGLVIPASSTTFSMRSTPKPVVINLNGKTLTITAAYDSANATASSAIVNNGSVILTGNGTIQATNNYTVRNYGTMVIDGVTIENGVMNFADLTVEKGNISNSRDGKHAIYGNNATLTINGGTFFNGNPGNATIFSYAGEVVINGGEFSIADGRETLGWTSCLLDAQGNAKFTINGGTVNGEIRDYKNNTTVYGGVFTHTSVKNFLADGYKAVENGAGAFVVINPEYANVVYNEATLANAVANGGKYLVIADITVDADTTLTIANGKTLELDLNGKTIAGVSDMTGSNRNMFDVRGTMTVYGGTLTVKHVGANMGWGSSTNVFNVTAGGVLNIKDATVENLGGSDMAFCVHLNNWGEVTLNAENTTFKSNYVGVRVFNSGYDMNNVKITGCDFVTGSPCFWVHNYTVADFGTADKAAAQEKLLNVTFTETTFTRTNGSKQLLRYGMTNAIYFDEAGNRVVKDAASLQAAIDDGATKILIDADITGYVTIPQAPGVEITIDGNGKTFVGAITVDGKSQAYPTAGLTIKNVNFVADSITTEACINLGVKGNTNTRYINNLTVENCTFDVPGAVAIKSHDNGDKNLTVIGCTVSARAHSLVQVNNVGDNGLLVENCKVYSKNGVNIGQSEKVTVKDCEFDVKGYAVRFGANGSANGVAETYVIENCQLKSQCAESDDAVVVLRVTADKATLTITNSTLDGTTEIINNSNADVVNK